MKKLLIIRHAKAVHEDHNGDFNRALKHSGEEDAIELAKKLKKKEIIPQKIYSSDALRAKMTAEIVAKKLNLGKPELIHDVYEASEATLMTVINNFKDDDDFVALAGHNPGLSYLVTYLTGEYCNLNTSGAALIVIDTDHWNLVSADMGKLEWYYEPSN